MMMDYFNIFLNSISLMTLPLWCSEPSLHSQLKDTQFDFIVVGGGSAGAVVASRLSENPNVNVLLLEAGGCPPNISAIPAESFKMQGTDVDWTFVTTKQDHAFFSDPNHEGVLHAGKMLGGGSSMNDMIYIRGNQDNYDSWAALGNPGWAFKDVLPFFLKSEGNTIPSQEIDTTYHNTTGPIIISEGNYKNEITQVFTDAGQQQGYPKTDPNGANQTGVSSNPFTINNGARSSTYNAYLRPAENRSNLVMVTNAVVTKVIFSTTDKLKVIGVQYTLNNQTYVIYATKEIILSAGALNTPKILLLSGIGPKQDLQKLNISVQLDLPGVGQNLQDHVGCGVLEWKINCSNCFYTGDPTSPENIFKWMNERKGPATITQFGKGVGFITTTLAEEKPNVPDVQIILLAGNGLNSQTDIYHEPWVNETTFSINPIAIAPKSRGYLTLESSDPTQPPIINPNYLSNADDMKVLVEGVKAAIAIVDSPAFKVYAPELNPIKFPGCESYKQFSDEYWECTCRYTSFPAYHVVGTCKMGPSTDFMAVVNAQLQVYNVTGLRVIDISIMPSITGGNTNAPAIMIGEKGADMIKKAYGI